MILIIESNQTNADLMVYLLNYYGYQTIIATDGEEGIALAKQHKPDLIISEINLPKLDGYEVAKILKNNDELKNIPLLAVTAYAMVGDRNKVRASGFDGYISKPINPSHFIIQIETLLPAKARSAKHPEMPIQLEPFQQIITQEKRGLAVVISDFVGSRELIKSLLETIGFEVVTADNANNALKIIESKSPDFILSDFTLPDMSGSELLKKVRENPQTHSIPFVLTSPTYPGDASMKTIKEIGVNRFILMPIESDIFIKIIKDICPAKKNSVA
jgi:CheY-like chemotaxis protein